MPLITWRDKLSVGIPEIDEDHRELIGHLNALYDAVQEGKGDRMVGDTLVRLIEYTRDHFAREEEAMRGVNYPHLAQHKAAHDELTSQVKQVAIRYAANPKAGIGQEVFDFLADWLKQHIVRMDRDIGEYTKGRRVWVHDASHQAG